jgi:hypothetical protein
MVFAYFTPVSGFVGGALIGEYHELPCVRGRL